MEQTSIVSPTIACRQIGIVQQDVSSLMERFEKMCNGRPMQRTKK